MGSKKFLNNLKISSLTRQELNKKLKKLPSLLYYYGDQHITVEYKLDEIELKLESVEAKLSARVRTRNAKKNLSETHIKAIVNATEEVSKIKQQKKDIVNTLRQLKLKLKSLNMMKDVIENIGHNIRNEKKTGKSV